MVKRHALVGVGAREQQLPRLNAPGHTQAQNPAFSLTHPLLYCCRGAWCWRQQIDVVVDTGDGKDPHRAGAEEDCAQALREPANPTNPTGNAHGHVQGR